jgi:hypothetical protein
VTVPTLPLEEAIWLPPGAFSCQPIRKVEFIVVKVDRASAL